MITIEMLPAAHGDALWIEYGTGRNIRRILIDGGPARSYEMGLRRRMAMIPEQQRKFELVVVTHIDADHIDGSSISFLLEYGDVSILLAGDAHASTLASSLGYLAAQRSVPRLKIDAVKLPHHESMGNVSSEWLQLVDCQRWLISTNGAILVIRTSKRRN